MRRAIVSEIAVPRAVAADEALAGRIVAAVRAAVGTAQGPVALHEPVFRGCEWDYVRSCLDDGWVSSVGAFVDRFEGVLADATGAAHVIATVNGTAALHLSLVALGVAPGDEVLVPGLSFVATANAVAHAGAVPHFVDVDADDLAVDPGRLAARLEAVARRQSGRLVNRETGRPITAVVVTHVMGWPADLAALRRVTDAWGLPVVEDAAEALGSRRDGRHAGTGGAVGTLSFNGNKIITTGGGGAVITDDGALADRARHRATTAKQPHPWRYDHDAVAWNYRLPNLNAALGVAQLEQLDGFLAAKRRLMDRYGAAFEEMAGVSLMAERPGITWNHWLVTLRLAADDAGLRDAVLAALHAAGLLARPVWTPLHTLAMYRDAPRDDMTATERLARQLICLPSGAALG